MTKEELLKRLHGSEWSDIEFKEARRSIPRSVYESVGAIGVTHASLDVDEVH